MREVELASVDWQPTVLPLYERRMVVVVGIEPTLIPFYEKGALPASFTTMVAGKGVEPLESSL